MRVFHFQGGGLQEGDTLPTTVPPAGFVWVSMSRREFEVTQLPLQACLQTLCGTSLVDLHVADLLNKQLPSHYDYTGQYDMLVFRRLAQARSQTSMQHPGEPLHQAPRRGGPPVLHRIDTSPVGFAVFDRLLLTVHPADCAVRDSYAARLLAVVQAQTAGPETGEGTRNVLARNLPTGAADLMLRLVNHMVDGYLDLRRELTRQLDHWQAELLDPGTRFRNWGSLLEARLALHQLDEICEDQRAALQDWIEGLADWQAADVPGGLRELDLLKVRSRDVLEHIERVVHHVRRLEQSAETAVQMHFSAQSHRANDIMRTLTVLTAIFLPLNLIAGVFGMNFEFMPLLHAHAGFWWAVLSMVGIALALALFFWRKRYVEHGR